MSLFLLGFWQGSNPYQTALACKRMEMVGWLLDLNSDRDFIFSLAKKKYKNNTKNKTEKQTKTTQRNKQKKGKTPQNK